MRLLKIPFDAGGMGHGNGSSDAPRKIIDALTDVYLNEQFKKATFDNIDVEIDNKNVQLSHENITKATTKEPFIALGGDHSITHPLIIGFAQHHGNSKFLVFDAHPDLVNNFHPPSQEDYLKTLIEDEILKPENILMVGIRNPDKLELDYMKEKNLRMITSKQIFEKGIEWTTQQLLAFCTKDDLPLYCSFDIDVVDPAYAPGTGWIEPGGITSREALYFIQHISQHIHSADIVEVNPPMDVNNMTSQLAAKLLVEFCK